MSGGFVMNKNIENYILYGKRKIEGKEIVFDFFHILFVGILILLFTTKNFPAFLIIYIALLISVVALGILGIKKNQFAWRHIYRGASGIGIATLYFYLSYIFIAMAGVDRMKAKLAYIIIFAVMCATIAIGIIVMISKDVYSKPQQSQLRLSSYGGAIFAFFLAPIIFRGLQQNVVAGVLAICSLLLGISTLLSISEWIKAAIIILEGIDLK